MKFSQKEKLFFKRADINTLYLFGSRAQGRGSGKSDFDIALLFRNTSKLKENTSELYQEIYELLADHFKTKSNIDIVFLHNASGQLKYHVVSEGVVLFDDDPKVRGQFEQRVILEHADFEYFRKMFEQAIMERVA